MSENDQQKEVQESKNVQLPFVVNPHYVPASYANIFQARIVDGQISISYGVGYPDQIVDENGKKQPVFAVNEERRLVMTLDAAKRLQNMLGHVIEETEKRQKEKV